MSGTLSLSLARSLSRSPHSALAWLLTYGRRPFRSSVRANGSELATTAAFLGGIVAQEVIKLLTAQYVPLDNTVIVDLIR